MTTQTHDMILHALECLNRHEIPAGGLPYAEGLHALCLDYNLNSLEQLDDYLNRLHVQGVTPSAIIKQPGGINFIATFAGYLLEIVSRQTSKPVLWYNYPEAVQLLPVNYKLPQEFFSSIVGIVDNNVCLPLTALSDSLHGRNSKACAAYVEQRCATISGGRSKDNNQWCQEYLEGLQKKKYIAGGNAYHDAMNMITFDDSFRSLEEIDVLLRIIRQQERVNENSYDKFMINKEKTNALLAITFYIGMLAAKHTRVPVKWLSFEEYRETLAQPNLQYRIEYHVACRLANTCYHPMKLLSAILFAPDGNEHSCLRYVKQQIANHPEPQLTYFERSAYIELPTIPALLKQAMKDAGLLAAFTLYAATEKQSFEPTLLERQEGRAVMTIMVSEKALPDALNDLMRPSLGSEPFQCLAYSAYANLPSGRMEAAIIEVRSYGGEPFAISLTVPYRRQDHNHQFAVYSVVVQGKPSLSDTVLAAAIAAFYEGAYGFIAPETGNSWWASCFTELTLPPLDTAPASAAFLADQEQRFRSVLSQHEKTNDEQQQDIGAAETKRLMDELVKIDFPKPIQALAMNLRPYLQVAPPGWMKNDPLYAQIQAMPTLYKTGKVVWAAMIQANSLMYKPEGESCPGEIIYDPDGKSGIALLLEAANLLLKLKETTPTEPDQLAYAQHLTNERTRMKFVLFPQSLAPLPLRMTSTWFWRMHLPDGMLTLGYFPVIVSPECPGDTIVLPALFWPKALKQNWMERSRQRNGTAIDLESTVLTRLELGNTGLSASKLEPPLATIFADAAPPQPSIKLVHHENSADTSTANPLFDTATTILENPLSSSSERQEAIQHLKGAAEQGHRDALRQLAYFYGEGHHVEQNNRLSLNYLLKLAQLGDETACVAAASFYLQGKGTPVHNLEARRWLKVAAAKGHSRAKHLLAQLEAQQEQAAAGTAEQPPTLPTPWVRWLFGAFIVLCLLGILAGLMMR